MARLLKWLLIAAALLLLVGAAVAFALHRWVNGDDFRARAEREAAAALGVPVQLGRLSVEVWPLPGVAAQDVRVQTRPALTVKSVEVRPVWTALLEGRLAIASLVVSDAVLPAQAISALGAAGKPRPAASAPPGASATVPWPRRALLERITWVDAAGQRLTFDARVRLGDDGVLDDASFKVLQGRFAGAQGRLERVGDKLPVQLQIGGGRITGELRLQPARAGAPQQLQGQLVTEGVEVAALTAPSRPLTGRLQAQTTLRASYRDIAGLADALTTQTSFRVNDAVIQGLDLAAAVQTIGLSRGGITRLDTLTGQVATQGRAVQLSNLVAQSSVLSATGQVAMAPNRSLNGRLNVDLATTKGVVAVPLVVSGTADAPSVMLTREALLGAAIGTAVAPGAGTAAGATLGDRVGSKLRGLFGK